MSRKSLKRKSVLDCQASGLKSGCLFPDACLIQLRKPGRGSSERGDRGPAGSHRCAHRHDQKKAQNDNQEERIDGLPVLGILDVGGACQAMRLAPVKGRLLGRHGFEISQPDSVVARRNYREQRQCGDKHGERMTQSYASAAGAAAQGGGTKAVPPHPIPPNLGAQRADAQQHPGQVQDEFSIVHGAHPNLSWPRAIFAAAFADQSIDGPIVRLSGRTPLVRNGIRIQPRRQLDRWSKPQRGIPDGGGRSGDRRSGDGRRKGWLALRDTSILR